MSGAEVMDVGRDALWLTIQLCAPVLLVGLVVGVVIGLVQALTQIQEQTLMHDAIAALPEATRNIFLLYHVDELSYREIGERLSITPRSVEYQLRRALIECRAYIKTRLACDEQGRRS